MLILQLTLAYCRDTNVYVYSLIEFHLGYTVFGGFFVENILLFWSSKKQIYTLPLSGIVPNMHIEWFTFIQHLNWICNTEILCVELKMERRFFHALFLLVSKHKETNVLVWFCFILKWSNKGGINTKRRKINRKTSSQFIYILFFVYFFLPNKNQIFLNFFWIGFVFA